MQRIHTTTAKTILNDPAAFRKEFIGMRTGRMGATEEEWVVGFIEGIFIYGTLRLPKPGEPMICLVASGDGKKITPSPVILQQVFGRTWMNCNGGHIDLYNEGEQFIPLSAVAPCSLGQLTTETPPEYREA